MKTKAELIALLPERLRSFDHFSDPFIDIDQANLALYYVLASESELRAAIHASNDEIKKLLGFDK